MFGFLGSYLNAGILWLRLTLVFAHTCMVGWATGILPKLAGGIALDTLIWNGVQIVVNIIQSIPLVWALIPTFLSK